MALESYRGAEISFINEVAMMCVSRKEVAVMDDKPFKAVFWGKKEIKLKLWQQGRRCVTIA
jgi:hypothetical protein